MNCDLANKYCGPYGILCANLRGKNNKNNHNIFKKNMIELKGNYCKDCKIFTDNIEQEALSLIYSILDHPVFDGAKIRIMPDVHAGKGIVIGFSCPITKAVAPAHIGCDIGCQMTTIEFDKKLDPSEYALFEHRLKKDIPMGFNLCESGLGISEQRKVFNRFTELYNRARSAWPEMIPEIGIIDENYIKKLCSRVGMDLGVFFKSLGTVGAGNHFLEYGENEERNCGYVTIHCGSRNFGLKVFNYWNKIANNHKITKDELKEVTEKVKASEPDKTKWKELISKAKEELTKNKANGYLYGAELTGYLSDMVIAQAYATINHDIISEKVTNIYHSINKWATVSDVIRTSHNYIDFQDHIMRKGSIKADEGRSVIIPFNMRDGVLIAKSKGNEDWNCTAPHGSGRIMSRSKAKSELSMEVFEEEMKDVYSTTICRGTLDESPMAYKDTQEIIKLIKDTVEVDYFIKPKINIKATEGE